MVAIGQEGLQALGGFGGCIRFAHAKSREPERFGLPAERLFHLEVQISVVVGLREAGDLIGQKLAEGRTGFDLGIPIFHNLVTVPIHI